MIKILIVDDSDVETQILRNIFSYEHDMLVIGCAKNGSEAVSMTEKFKPDIITMDIQMPVMNGLDAIKLIMSRYPTPIIVISALVNNPELNMTFRALEVGALSVIAKPFDVMSANFNEEKRRILEQIRVMSDIKVVTRRFPSILKSNKQKTNIPIQMSNSYEIVAIGSSVGGPQVLKTILSELPASFPTPIVIVQHMTTGFMAGFVKWLNDSLDITVKVASHNEHLSNGVVYFAPDNYHLEVVRKDNKLMTTLNSGRPICGFCPSVNTLFHSVAVACQKNAIGILLTGMGSDGAEGLLAIKNAHGHTFIQDKESAVVFGMAGVALSIGAVDKIIDINNIASYLNSIIAHHL